VLPFSALGSIHADPVDPMPVLERSMLLRELPVEAVDALLRVAGPEADSAQVVLELRLLGGALAEPPRHRRAVCSRDAAYSLISIGIAAPPVLAVTAAQGAQVLEALAPWGTGTTQPNFVASAEPAVVARSYDDATLRRLASLVATYDPQGRIAAGRGVRATAVSG
jgi:xanthosine utilization system XapX-like protein